MPRVTSPRPACGERVSKAGEGRRRRGALLSRDASRAAMPDRSGWRHSVIRERMPSLAPHPPPYQVRSRLSGHFLPARGEKGGMRGVPGWITGGRRMFSCDRTRKVRCRSTSLPARGSEAGGQGSFLRCARLEGEMTRKISSRARLDAAMTRRIPSTPNRKGSENRGFQVRRRGTWRYRRTRKVRRRGNFLRAQGVSASSSRKSSLMTLPPRSVPARHDMTTGRISP